MSVRSCEGLKVSKRGETWSDRKCKLGDINKTAQLVSDRAGIRTQDCSLLKPLQVETFFSDKVIPLNFGLESSTKMDLREINFISFVFFIFC